MVLTYRLGRAHLGDEHARGGDEVAPGLDLELDAVTDSALDAGARLIPQGKVCFGIDGRVTRAIGYRQAAAGGDRAHIATQALELRDHGLAHALEVRDVGARSDVHVQAHEVEPEAIDARQRVRHV